MHPASYYTPYALPTPSRRVLSVDPTPTDATCGNPISMLISNLQPAGPPSQSPCLHSTVRIKRHSDRDSGMNSQTAIRAPRRATEPPPRNEQEYSALPNPSLFPTTFLFPCQLPYHIEPRCRNQYWAGPLFPSICGETRAVYAQTVIETAIGKDDAWRNGHLSCFSAENVCCCLHVLYARFWSEKRCRLAFSGDGACRVLKTEFACRYCTHIHAKSHLRSVFYVLEFRQGLPGLQTEACFLSYILHPASG
ncbi:hypothetical protein BCR34DRAFT_275839 [Clohesyomyces aquaticus]|uniref:Uncharacterized protein n=1 Tax=Clohesyomyces aquaticus TaxID=1231657 RepID=A0A1Y1ZSE5_9PLEO|nr:hypothetical protein BCR34DRAFT_275839 [Clohesyomyces aquaticus]